MAEISEISVSLIFLREQKTKFGKWRFYETTYVTYTETIAKYKGIQCIHVGCNSTERYGSRAPFFQAIIKLKIARNVNDNSVRKFVSLADKMIGVSVLAVRWLYIINYDFSFAFW